jgi:hypothetical protein
MNGRALQARGLRAGLGHALHLRCFALPHALTGRRPPADRWRPPGPRERSTIAFSDRTRLPGQQDAVQVDGVAAIALDQPHGHPMSTSPLEAV